MLTQTEFNGIVSRLRKQKNDDTTVEAKACAKGLSSDIWESVSAFANTSGGLIICGLDENEGFRAVPDFSLDRVRDQFVAGIGDGGQPAKIQPAPHYELSRAEVDGIQVLGIEIMELDALSKPCYIKARGIEHGGFKRVDDKDIQFSATEVYELKNALVPNETDGSIVPEATLEDLDDELIDAIIEARRRRSPRMLRGVDTRERQLERLNIINKAEEVRLAGLLTVGQYPQQFYPKLVIDVAVHPGLEKAEPGKPRFIDRQICDGAVSECIGDALIAIGRNLRTISVVQGVGRIDEWEIPEEVLREALVNAVVHREYAPQFTGRAVSVDIYSNRIEVANPGGLWGGKTLESLADGSSRCRNARLMSLMEALPLSQAAGNISEGQGSGIPSMLHVMEERSLAAPRFFAGADTFKVTFYRPSAEQLSAVRPVVPSRMNAAQEVSEASSHVRKTGLSGRIDTRRGVAEGILEMLASGDALSAQEMAQTLDVNISAVRYHLPRLIEAGNVAPTADAHSKKRRYVLVK